MISVCCKDLYMILVKRQEWSSEKTALPRTNVPIKKKKKDFMRYKEETIAF